MKVQIKGFPLLIIHGYKWIAGYRGHFTKIFDGEKRNKGKIIKKGRSARDRKLLPFPSLTCFLQAVTV